MKMTLFFLTALLVLSSSMLLAQSIGGVAVYNSEAHPLYMPSHDQHAAETSLAPEHGLYVRTASAIGDGERPLWEFGSPKAEVPLGDIARLYREQHATVKKAVKVLEK